MDWTGWIYVLRNTHRHIDTLKQLKKKRPWIRKRARCGCVPERVGRRKGRLEMKQWWSQREEKGATCFCVWANPNHFFPPVTASSLSINYSPWSLDFRPSVVSPLSISQSIYYLQWGSTLSLAKVVIVAGALRVHGITKAWQQQFLAALWGCSLSMIISRVPGVEGVQVASARIQVHISLRSKLFWFFFFLSFADKAVLELAM